MDKEDLELNKVHNLNCLDGLKKLKKGSVDCIITDPPYCVGTTSNGHKGSWQDNNLIAPFFDELFRFWQRVLKEGGTIYVNTDWRTYPLLYPILRKYFDVRNCIVWDYEWIKAGIYYRYSHEFIIFATKGTPKRKFGGGERDVWRIKPINFSDKNKLHQAQKPEELVRKMINHGSDSGDVVLDCFMGSGTTGVVCKEENRKFYGFEIDDVMCEIANGRIGKASYSPKLGVFPWI